MNDEAARQLEDIDNNAKLPVNYLPEDQKQERACSQAPLTNQLPRNKQPFTPKKRNRSSIKRNKIFPELLTNTELCKYLMLSSDTNDLKRRIILLINKLGFSDFSFSPAGSIQHNSETIYSVPAELIEDYCQNNYHKYDSLWPNLKASEKGIFGSTLHDYVYAAPCLTDEVLKNLEIIKLIKSFNYEEFYAVPAKSETGENSALIIWGLNESPSEFQDRVKLCEGRLELLCHAIDRVFSINFENLINKCRMTPEKLTSRPRELLTYLAFHDCTLYQAAERMNISVKTVNVHIAAARKLLKVKTTTNAISRAIEYGLIKDDR